MLRAAKQFPKPAEYLQSNYQARVEPGACSECGSCHERCPMEALGAGEGVTVVDHERCIGCGVCVPACPSDAIRLHPKARPSVPPRDVRTLYARILAERFGLLGAAKRVGRVLLGRQV
jgi:ferredoxin